MNKIDKGKHKTIKQQMRENVFVNNNICDVRDGLKDLIIANFGTAKRIREHLFPNAKPEVEDSTVDKFMDKYSKWLEKQPEAKDNVEKFLDKNAIKVLLNKELTKRKRGNKIMFNSSQITISKPRHKHSSVGSEKLR